MNKSLLWQQRIDRMCWILHLFDREDLTDEYLLNYPMLKVEKQFYQFMRKGNRLQKMLIGKKSRKEQLVFRVRIWKTC